VKYLNFDFTDQRFLVFLLDHYNICMVFIDLKKANDRVKREVINVIVIEKMFPTMYINLIQDINEGLSTIVCVYSIRRF